MEPSPMALAEEEKMEDKKLSDEDIERILNEYRAKKAKSEVNADPGKNTKKTKEKKKANRSPQTSPSEKVKSPEEQRIDEIIKGADDYDFDPKAAGYEEIVDGIWWSGVGDFSDIYLDSSELSTDSKKTAQKNENFYWLYKKSFMLGWFKGVIVALLIVLIVCYPYESNTPEDAVFITWFAVISLTLIIGATLLMFLMDFVYLTYHFDRKKNRTKIKKLEIWHLVDESDYNFFAIGNAARYFPESLRLLRGYICFHDLSKDTRPTCEKVMNGIHDTVVVKRKDLKGLLRLRIVFTAKKWQLFKKLRETDPDMQYEVEYYTKSKVIKEIRPLKGKSYSPLALEILCLINRMYP